MSKFNEFIGYNDTTYFAKTCLVKNNNESHSMREICGWGVLNNLFKNKITPKENQKIA